ncbi:MAG: hypothetical protein IJN50_06330 [Clostridia bacterium]|nr:hypothetical protein [Clostridia bacterium]
MAKSKRERKEEKRNKRAGLSPDEIARKKEFDEMRAIWYRSAPVKSSKSSKTDIPRRNFVEHVEVDESKALKKVDQAMVFDYIRTRTNGFNYEYMLAEDLMFMRGLGKKVPNLSKYPSNVIVEGEANLSQLRMKLKRLDFRMKNRGSVQMEVAELKEILSKGSRIFSSTELDILKRAAVTELGSDKASEILGKNVVEEIMAENEKYNSEQSK